MAKKILLIEDQPPIVKLLTSRLRAHGYKVVSALDGQAGMDMVSSEKPDLIITDLALPKINGNAIVRILKESPQFKDTPIIMLSAFVNDTMAKAVDFPADVYIAKPFDADPLLAKVKELLEKK